MNVAKKQSAVEREIDAEPESAAPLQDRVEISEASRVRRDAELEQLNVSPEELKGYLEQLKAMDEEELDIAKMALVKKKLESGAYGKEALSQTVERLGEDLGFFPQ